MYPYLCTYAYLRLKYVYTSNPAWILPVVPIWDATPCTKEGHNTEQHRTAKHTFISCYSPRSANQTNFFCENSIGDWLQQTIYIYLLRYCSKKVNRHKGTYTTYIQVHTFSAMLQKNLVFGGYLDDVKLGEIQIWGNPCKIGEK